MGKFREKICIFFKILRNWDFFVKMEKYFPIFEEKNTLIFSEKW